LIIARIGAGKALKEYRDVLLLPRGGIGAVARGPPFQELLQLVKVDGDAGRKSCQGHLQFRFVGAAGYG